MAFYQGRVYGRTNWASTPVTVAKPMNSKYDGKCKRCNAGYKVGDPILWKPGFVTHATEAQCEAAKVAQIASYAANTTVAPVADMTGVVAFLSAAKGKGLQRPKMRFTAPGGGELKLSVAGEKAAVPGSINVVVNEQWLGRINPDGTAYWKVPATAELIAQLVTISADPVKAATEYGKLTGNCCFCETALGHGEDKRSLEVGYGQGCARKYKLFFPSAAKGRKAHAASAVTQEAA